jgi:hypothetical protein
MDPEVQIVLEAIRALDPTGIRMASVLRATIDQLYDGQRTGRYRWDQLFKTEKTHCGTLVEINLQREFKFSDGRVLDYSISGLEVDCKYSQEAFGWMVPPEAVGHVCLLMSAADTAAPRWSAGLIKVSAGLLSDSRNRDHKAKLNSVGRDAVSWLFRDQELPTNTLLQLSGPDVLRIFAQASGQQRVNELFRAAVGRIVGRNVVATVAQQDDYMKRVRGNGGARTALKSEGIVILGQYRAHAAIAQALQVPVPRNGESLAIRLCPATGLGSAVAEIGGQYWKVAGPGDPVVTAPDLPAI